MPNPRWAIIHNGLTAALKVAPTKEKALARYPGCDAVEWTASDPPLALQFCGHCGGGNTKKYDQQFWYCCDCRRTWSLAVWRNKPELEMPDPTLSHQEKIAELTRQGANQRQIAKMLEISQGLVSKKFPKKA